MQALKFMLLVCLFSLIACQEANREDQTNKVVATTNIIGDALRFLAGDLCDLHVLMGPGVDPHSYRASQGDVSLLASADLIVYNGLHLEGKMGGLFEKLAQNQRVFSMSGGMQRSRILYLDDDTNTPDPHVWFDPLLWLEGVSRLADTLKIWMPEHADSIHARVEHYSEEILRLQTFWKQRFDELPQERKILITSHDAFGYLGREFGIEVHGLQGMSTLSEFGVKDISRLSDLIIDKKVPALFTESSVNPKSIRALQENCRRRGHDVKLGGELFSDALGARGSFGGTYAGMLNHNLNTIYEALK